MFCVQLEFILPLEHVHKIFEGSSVFSGLFSSFTLFFFLKTGSPCSSSQSGTCCVNQTGPNSQRFPCLCLQSTRTEGVHHHAWSFSDFKLMILYQLFDVGCLLVTCCLGEIYNQLNLLPGPAFSVGSWIGVRVCFCGLLYWLLGPSWQAFCVGTVNLHTPVSVEHMPMNKMEISRTFR